MNDPEIESLLAEAGYTYDLAIGRYVPTDDAESEGYNTEDMAGIMEIPVDDLLRWEEEQQSADNKVE